MAMSQQEGHRQAPQCDPELRRDGRAVHRQDRHADAGHAIILEAPLRSQRRGFRPRSRVRLSEQLLPVRPARTSARRRGPASMSSCEEQLKPGARSARSTRSRSTFERRRMSVVLERRVTRSHHPHLQGRSRRGLRGLQRYAIDDDGGPARCEPLRAGAAETTATLNADGYRVVAVAYQRRCRQPRPSVFRGGREPTSPCSATSRSSIHRRRRPPGHCHSEGAWRAGEDPHRRQRHRLPQDLPRRRTACGSYRPRQR